MSGTAGRLKGERNEEHLTQLLKETMLFPWMKNVDRSGWRNDSKGIDIIVTTTSGRKLYLQVKSSAKQAQRFRKKYKEKKYGNKIAAIVVFDGIEDKELLQRAYSLLEKMYFSTEDQKVFTHDENDWEAVTL